MHKVIVGTRGSKLAVTQTQWVVDQLRALYKETVFELKIISTKGDEMSTIPLDKIGDKGLFTQAIESELRSGTIHFAVHSLKDLPSLEAEGLALARIPKREDPRDVLVFRAGIQSLDALPLGSKIGTGSKRRLFQLMEKRPDLVPVPIRGNVETRIAKIESEGLDGVILAAAGLHRLNLEGRIGTYLDENWMVPAPAQGALGLQYRADDLSMRDMLNAISDENSDRCVRAERAFLKHIEGSCHVPIGALATREDQTLTLRSVFGDENGANLYRFTFIESIENPEVLGMRAAEATLKAIYSEVLVSLVGAGPGDASLITVKGLERLKSCDAVVYDRLASPELLKHVPAGAVRHYVGKAAADHTMRQEDINALLVSLSKHHKKIVRLKGGDAYVFGRGGEEALTLKAHHIPFEVVPGITSPIAGLAYAGIPITHREMAASFHVFTGHFSLESHTLDFKTIAQLEGTLVFLMSIAKCKAICEALCAHGKSSETPIAMVSNATTGAQEVIQSTLADTSPFAQIKSPAFLVVGEVVKLREHLNWFEALPLFGKRVLVTRASKQAGSFTKRLTEKGATVTEMPAIEIKPVHPEILASKIRALETYTHLWFTSENAVHPFFKALEVQGKDARVLAHLKILAIGTVTAKALMQYGIRADYIPERFTQEGIAAYMVDQVYAQDRILLPTAEETRNLLEETFKDKCYFETVALYKTHEISEPIEAIETYDYITFTSASSVRGFHKSMSKEAGLPEHVKIVSIGPVTTAELERLGYPVHLTADVHTIEGMLIKIEEDGRSYVDKSNAL